MKADLEKVKNQLHGNLAFAQATVAQEGQNLTGWFDLSESEKAEAVLEARSVIQRVVAPTTDEWHYVRVCWQTWAETRQPVSAEQLQVALWEIGHLQHQRSITETFAYALQTLFKGVQQFLTAFEQGVKWVKLPPAGSLTEHIRDFWLTTRQSGISQEAREALFHETLFLLRDDLVRMGILEKEPAEREVLARMLTRWLDTEHQPSHNSC